MNKLVIDNSIEDNDIFVINDTEMIVDLSNSERYISIHVVNGTCLKGFIKTNNTKNKIKYIIDDNCEVTINKLAIDSSDEIEIVLNDKNSIVKYTTSIINYKDNIYKQIINHKSDDTTSKIRNHCINIFDNEFKFVIDGIIEKDAERVDLKQDNKIINLRNGKSNILPNLIVDNNDINASHSAYIGTFDEDTKFYMMSRGLTSNECDDLLIKSFLLNGMELQEKERDIFSSIIETINK